MAKVKKTATRKVTTRKTTVRTAGGKSSTRRKKVKKGTERLVATASGKTPRQVFESSLTDLKPPGGGTPPAEEGVSVDIKITQEDIDAHLLLTLLDANSGLLANLHTMALEGKKWLAEEPDKANLFLATAKKTSSYRPLKLLFEMMEIDEAILNVPAPSELGKKNIQSGANQAVAFGTSFTSLLSSLNKLGLGLNLEI